MVKASQIARFRRLARDMAKLLEEIRQTEPGANLYLEDSGNWYLLSGEDHDVNGRSRQDRKIALEFVPHSGGGAW